MRCTCEKVLIGSPGTGFVFGVHAAALDGGTTSVTQCGLRMMMMSDITNETNVGHDSGTHDK